MANPSCIVESGKLSPVGQRTLALFAGQNERRIIIVIMRPSFIVISKHTIRRTERPPSSIRTTITTFGGSLRSSPAGRSLSPAGRLAWS